MAATLQDSGLQKQAGGLINALQENWRRPEVLKGQFERWISVSPPAVEALVATFSGGAQGAVLGGLMGQITSMDPSQASKISASSNNPELQRQMMTLQQGGPWVQARNFAVFSGVSAGITVAMRRFRNKEDIRNVLVAGFGSGAAFALVSGMAGPKPLQGAFTSGVLMALVQGAFYKIGAAWSGRNKPDSSPEYTRVRHLLESLGMPQYQKALRRGGLNDSTIWLWNESALHDVRIPPGPRLVLLHHVDRYRHLLKPNIPLPNSPFPPPPGRSAAQEGKPGGGKK